MGNIQDLKEKNRLEEVIEESGYILDHKAGARYWVCKSDPSLSVDLKSQFYYWGEESGDVIAWLRARMGWEFGQVLTYLRYRQGLVPAERPRLVLASAEANIAPEVSSPAAAEWDSGIDDDRVRRALQLGFNFPYPGGIEALALEQSVWVLFGVKRSLPQIWVPVIGVIPDNTCIFCNREFLYWEQLDQVYLMLSVPGDLFGEKEFYCSSCVSKIKNWHAAIDLLIACRSGFAEKGLLESLRTPIDLSA